MAQESYQTRREFLKKVGIVGAGILGGIAFPSLSLASSSPYKIKDFLRDSDQVLLARMIFGEARGLFKLDEDYREPTMIGFTALNRVKRKIRGKDLKQVILAPKQYSCFNPKDSNFIKIKNPVEYNLEAWKKSLVVSRRLLELEEKLSHLNYGQTHYHAKDMEEYPQWSKSEKMKKVFGKDYFKHYFYKKIV